MADFGDYQLLSAPTIAEESDPEIGPVIAACRAQHKNQFRILHKQLQVSPTDSLAEVRTNFTNLFDGVATPIVVWMDSTDNAQDKAGGTGMLTGKALLTTASDIVEDTITLNGTTPVTGTSLATHVNDARGATYGSGGAPVGTVKVVNQADNEVYATIAAADVCTINARTYIPTGWNWMVVRAKASATCAAAAAGIGANEGYKIRWVYVAGDTNNEIITRTIWERAFGSLGGALQDIKPTPVVRAGGTDVYITMYVQALDTDLNQTVNLEWTILMWK